MNAGGLVLVIAGVWVLSQVLAGNALQRLGVIADASADTSGSAFPNVPDRGYSNVPHNPQGYPL